MYTTSWLSGVNGAIGDAEASANSESSRLSNLEIDARVAYYKEVSAAERSYRASMIGVQTTQRLREMKYVNTAAIQNLENSLSDIQTRSYTSYCSPMMWYYGVFGMGSNVDVYV
ncbi:MAG: hypothetical protein PHE53_12330 [Thermoguttaceae bacterium]|nr:hypothetical protein [Thermoguttaceae bacterium]